MALWLFDPIASTFSSSVQFRLPYPKSNWREERAWNEPLLNHMKHSLKVYELFSKPSEDWTAEDKAFFRELRAHDD